MLATRSMSPLLTLGNRVACSVMLSLAASGCGGSTEPVTPAAPENAASATAEAAAPTTEANTAGSATASSPSKTKHRRDEVWVDEKGQKWFGNVPMDAFFDNPYEVASNQTPIGGGAVQVASNADAATTEKPAVTTPEKEPAMADETAAADPASSGNPSGEPPATDAAADSWAGLISIAAIDEEVKSIRNFMTDRKSVV